ncbi:pseudaminic acid biosynthesis-associated methylase [Gymnodinialimonas hymeniacidonis]|uniref:pseudaminic acid biosynthesis-associated methylase n=1 Tax=Gymnodinialimonas hymeniacidonis TaxID=3126508 RepID=UPI0034C6CB1A
MTYKTEQEAFWSGAFGSDYIDRNKGEELLASNLNFFTKALRCTQRPKTCIEFGANIGMNMRALQLLYPEQEQHAVEINADAAALLGKVIPPENVHHMSIFDFVPDRTYDLALIKGVLIHINPDMLNLVYDRLTQAAGRYLLVAEYYNPRPVAIPYRGHNDRLFKRDFAGEILDRHDGFELVDYGFAYHRDPSFPQDDITWFLMERVG